MLLFDWFWKPCIQSQRKYKHGATCSVGSHEIFNFIKEIKQELCVLTGVLCLTILLRAPLAGGRESSGTFSFLNSSSSCSLKLGESGSARTGGAGAGVGLSSVPLSGVRCPGGAEPGPCRSPVSAARAPHAPRATGLVSFLPMEMPSVFTRQTLRNQHCSACYLSNFHVNFK